MSADFLDEARVGTEAGGVMPPWPRKIDDDVLSFLMGLSEARALTDQIKSTAIRLWNKIEYAYTHRAWQVLGYENWDTYCQAEFGHLRLRMPREDRREVVYSLREAGLSIRAIASATGIDKNTVQTDLAHLYEIHTLGSPVEGPVERAKAVWREDPSLSGFRVMGKAGVCESTVRKARQQLEEEANPTPEPEPEQPEPELTIPPAVQDYKMVIKSDGTALLNVTFSGDEESCEIPLNQGRLDIRITQEVAEHLASRLDRMPGVLRELEKRLRHRAKPLPAGVSIKVKSGAKPIASCAGRLAAG